MGWFSGGGFGSGFAGGVTAGSTAMARGLQAQIDKENQEYLQAEREEQRLARKEYAQAAAPAQTETQQGVGLTNTQTGQTTYVPQAAVESGGVAKYTSMTDAEGKPLYTVTEPTMYAETRTKDGQKMLRQTVVSPEHQELGYDPNKGLQDQYNAATNQRLLDVAKARGRWSEAASISGLTTNELNQKKLTLDIEDRPAARAEQTARTRLHTAQADEAERTLRINKIEDEAFAASRTPESALKYFNDRDPDDGPVEIVPTKDGKQQFVQTNKDGTKTVIGKPFTNWDEGRDQVLGGIRSYAKTAYEKGIEQRNELERIDARGKWDVRKTAAARESHNIKWGPGQQDEYNRIEGLMADALQKGNNAEAARLGVQLKVLTNKVLMYNNRPPQALTVPQPSDRTWTDARAFQQTRNDFIENYRAPNGKGFYSMTEAQQQAVLRENNLLTPPQTRSSGPTPAAGGGGNFEQGGGVVSGANAASRSGGPAAAAARSGGGNVGPHGPVPSAPAPVRGRPQMPPETNPLPEGRALDTAKQELRAAEDALKKYTVRERQRNPEGYATALALVRAREDAVRNAMDEWAGVAPNTGPVTGRGLQ